MPAWGTIANVAAILVGGGIGMLARGRMPERCQTIVFQGLGLCVLIVGVKMALGFTNPLLPIFSVVAGGIFGELIDIEGRFEKLAAWVKRTARSDSAHFVDGMVTASLLYCVGPMAILGSFDDGLRGDATVLFTKSMLDGFASVALAAAYGVGVLFSVLPLAIYQFSLTFFASLLQSAFPPHVLAQLTATGGVLIMGIGVNLLGAVKIRISNLLPALIVIIVLAWIFG
jgi:uncharacterized membrane protein YqgA involved in biofilm formation